MGNLIQMIKRVCFSVILKKLFYQFILNAKMVILEIKKNTKKHSHNLYRKKINKRVTKWNSVDVIKLHFIKPGKNDDE